jgi:uncharacterized protein (UPF0335 family)
MAAAKTSKARDVGGIAGHELRSFVERIESLNEEIDALNADKRDVYAQAKGTGFDTKVMKVVIKRRGMNAADRAEADSLLAIYEHALESGSTTLGTEDATRARARAGAIGARAEAAQAAAETAPEPAPEPADSVEKMSNTPKGAETASGEPAGVPGARASDFAEENPLPEFLDASKRGDKKVVH